VIKSSERHCFGIVAEAGINVGDVIETIDSQKTVSMTPDLGEWETICVGLFSALCC
jgi:hypothetical protein